MTRTLTLFTTAAGVALALILATVTLVAGVGNVTDELGQQTAPTLALSAHRLPMAPACRLEDGSGQRRCVWDARHMGNGAGRSFVVRNGGEDNARIRYVSHRTAHRMIARWRATH